jgi:shikimate dehydrogenase
MNRYGLIGYPLTHSFSQRYFTEKFAREAIADCRYDLFDLPDVAGLADLLKTPGLRGLNVTIPHKQAVFPYLTHLDDSARRVGAVNVIRVESDGSIAGYNSDYYGFKQSLTEWFSAIGFSFSGIKAVVLGTGGASKAVTVALDDLQIPFWLVSRTKSDLTVGYDDLPELIADYHLIINTTPVGTYPNVAESPALPYPLLTARHALYDLVYNPAETEFMRQGRERGAAVQNGYRMLVLQAERAWEIWQSGV